MPQSPSLFKVPKNISLPQINLLDNRSKNWSQEAQAIVANGIYRQK